MNADSPVPVYSEAAHAPWREILRHRFSGRRDRALVLRDTSGALHVLAARRGDRTGADAVLDTYGDGAA
ncbi:hypothetical protein KDA82_33895, partial [Streptomyces daliensis]|nr:hypothetical protein [Streptomyces daliensis]